MNRRAGAASRLALGCGIAVVGALISLAWAPAFVLGSFAAPLAWMRVPTRQGAALSAAFIGIGLVVLWLSTAFQRPDDGLWPIGLVIWLILALGGTAFSLGIGTALRGWRGWRADQGRVGEL